MSKEETRESLILIPPCMEYKAQIEEMLDEWEQYNATHDANRSPAAIFRDRTSFTDYVASFSLPPKAGFVPSSTFFAFDKRRNIMVGAVDIRHYLNERLLLDGGHIGDGVRPSERRKGYATEIIRLALVECAELGIHRVLMVCDKVNIGSMKSIINNGGVLENELAAEDGTVVQRYWIELP